MVNEMKENLKVTWIFFLVRFAASLLIGLVYIFTAAAIQYAYVGFLGETKFNYIMGGIFSLMIGSLLCTYLGKLLFMFVRGWHMAAMAFSAQIRKRNLPPLEAGMTVFSKHFSSFAVVYGAQLLIGKLASKGVEYLWDLLNDVPILCNLERFAKNPMVSKIGSDILDTGFDAAMFYIIRYTKPGLSDDLAAVPSALKRYLYALPQVMLTSVSGYLLFYFTPRVLKWGVFAYLLWYNGAVAGVLLCALTYPIFYILQHTLFDPLESMLLISCYSKHCSDEPEDDSIYKSIVDSILRSSGFSEMFGEEEEESSPAEEDKQEPSASEPEPVVSNDEFSELQIDVEPEFATDDIVDVSPAAAAVSLDSLIQEVQSGQPDISDIPLADEVAAGPSRSSGTSLWDIANRYANAAQDTEADVEAPTTGKVPAGATGLFAQQLDEDVQSPSEQQQPRSSVLRGLGGLNAELLGSLAPAADIELSGPDIYLAGGSDEDFE